MSANRGSSYSLSDIQGKTAIWSSAQSTAQWASTYSLPTPAAIDTHFSGKYKYHSHLCLSWKDKGPIVLETPNKFEGIDEALFDLGNFALVGVGSLSLECIGEE